MVFRRRMHARRKAPLTKEKHVMGSGAAKRPRNRRYVPQTCAYRIPFRPAKRLLRGGDGFALGDLAAGDGAGVGVAEHDPDAADVFAALGDLDLLEEVDALAGNRLTALQMVKVKKYVLRWALRNILLHKLLQLKQTKGMI